MLDSFFTKGFKAAKCKTLLKLTIPRIKLLRNRRESQLKQMRRDIAKLLETGQEATARIWVEHIIREEKMMAAQEIVELFSELISVRLPIIETQRECPLDLKEAISSVCFAAPRCADLPELQQVQMLFAAKYGREFVAAATELMPECEVNRQLVELLSVRAPDPEVKLKLLKDIAEEHELDWDPAASESELLKPHEDLLNGPTQFVGGSKLPLTNEKHYESTYAARKQSPTAHSDSDDDVETMDFPEVPKVSIRQTEPINDDDTSKTIAHEPNNIPSVANYTEPESEPQKVLEEVSSVTKESDLTKIPPALDEANKQFVPFMSPSLSSMTFPVRESEPPQPAPRTRSDIGVDLQDVLAAAQSAADSAERAAASARSAASLAQVRISELIKKQSNKFPVDSSDNPFHLDTCEPNTTSLPQISRDDSSRDNIAGVTDLNAHKVEYDPPVPELPHQCQRLPSMDDEYFSYPNLFKRQDSDIEPSTHSTN